MSIWDEPLNRWYRCGTMECQAEIVCKEKPTDIFRLDCPFCHNPTLLLHHANCSVTTLVGLTTPKTWGAISEQNHKRHKNEEPTEPVKKKPDYWWRKPGQKEVDFSVLKNPKNYIATGQV